MPNKFRTRVCRMDREACRGPERIPALGSTLAEVNIRIKVETFFFRRHDVVFKLRYVLVIPLVDGCVHLTETSSLWPQLCLPQLLRGHDAMSVSVPRQRTSSNQIIPLPGYLFPRECPWYLCVIRKKLIYATLKNNNHWSHNQWTRSWHVQHNKTASK